VIVVAIQGVSVDLRDSSGATSLYYAARYASPDGFFAVAPCFFFIAFRRPAFSKGNVRMVELLLSHGADANASTARRTVLHSAAEWGHVATVFALLKAGARPTAVDADGATALDAARKLGRGDVVAILESASLGDSTAAHV
jgi:hypothetical protein